MTTSQNSDGHDILGDGTAKDSDDLEDGTPGNTHQMIDESYQRRETEAWYIDETTDRYQAINSARLSANDVNLASYLGLTHQASKNKVLDGAPIVTMPENCPVDRLLIATDQARHSAMPRGSQYRRCLWLLDVLRNRTLPARDMIAIDDKSVFARTMLLTHSKGRWYHICRVRVSESQKEYVSFLLDSFGHVPELVAVLPVLQESRSGTLFRKTWYQIDALHSPAFMPQAAFAFDQRQLAMHLTSLSEAMYLDDDWEVPGTHATLKPRSYHKTCPRAVVIKWITDWQQDATGRAFEKLYREIQQNTTARDFGFDLDFPDHPWAGDGVLRAERFVHPSSSESGMHEWFLEFKHNLHKESASDVTTLTTYRSWRSEEARKARSMFHPLRSWSYLFLDGPDHAYFIPCTEIQPEWFSGDEEIVIARSAIHQYRIDTTSQHWFDRVLKIIRDNPSPTRSESLASLASTDEDIKRFTRYMAKAEDDDSDVSSDDDSSDGSGGEQDPSTIGVSTSTSSYRKYVPTWKDDRLQTVCRKRGRATVMPIPSHLMLGSSVFDAFYNWSDPEDKKIFDDGPRTPPLYLHPLSLDTDSQLLCISSIPFQGASRSDSHMVHKHVGNPQFVSHTLLNEPSNPRLYCIDVLEIEDSVGPGSHLLIPSECIDFKNIYETLKASPDFKHLEFNSIRELNALRRKKDKSRHGARFYIDLAEYIHGLHLYDFLVRDGDEYYDALIDFAEAHAREGPKRVSWYKHREYKRNLKTGHMKWGPRLQVHQNYLVSHKDLRTWMVWTALGEDVATKISQQPTHAPQEFINENFLDLFDPAETLTLPEVVQKFSETHQQYRRISDDEVKEAVDRLQRDGLLKAEQNRERDWQFTRL